jgi:hypothetical protein
VAELERLERFTAEECALMARSIWGTDMTARAQTAHPYVPPSSQKTP